MSTQMILLDCCSNMLSFYGNLVLISGFLMSFRPFMRLRFHYQDKTPPIDYVVEVSSTMRLYPAKDWLVGSSLPSKFSSGIIQMLLDELTPENVRIFWESKKFEGQTDMVEPWYGTGYSLENINSLAIQQWISAAPNQNLHLPARNVFIPTDLSIKDLAEKVKFPVLLRKSSYSRLWYKPDTLFFIPKAYVKMDFNCPSTSHSPEAVVLTYFYTVIDGLLERICL